MALIVSAVLHVVVLWVALSRPPLPPPPKANTIEFDFTTTVKPVAPVEVKEPPPVAPPVKPRVAVAPVKAPVPSAAPAPVEPPPAPQDAVATTDQPTRVADQPLATDMPTLNGSAFLVPRQALDDFADAGPRATVAVKTAEPLNPDALVKRIAFETVGRGRVERGLVHPYYSQLGKALIKNWDADRVVGQGGLKNYAEQFAQNTKLFNEIWLDRTAAYGKTGSPLVNNPTAKRSAPVNDRIQGLPGVDLEARKEMAKEMREQFKATRRATLRVVQDTQGKLISVELVDPSNDVKVDNEALVDVRAAAEKLPPPPPEVIGTATRISSLWSFELIISISPPVPTFSFEFDEALGTIDARLPLDRRIYKKVRLISVE